MSSLRPFWLQRKWIYRTRDGHGEFWHQPNLGDVMALGGKIREVPWSNPYGVPWVGYAERAGGKWTYICSVLVVDRMLPFQVYKHVRCLCFDARSTGERGKNRSRPLVKPDKQGGVAAVSEWTIRTSIDWLSSRKLGSSHLAWNLNSFHHTTPHPQG